MRYACCSGVGAKWNRGLAASGDWPRSDERGENRAPPRSGDDGITIGRVPGLRFADESENRRVLAVLRFLES